MHQTFYIDIDEEITSIVDRLRKSKSKEVIIVVPKRAILIQSIVNLKLLKKEAEAFGRDLIIVTQDKLGKMLIEKAGIEVEQRLDDIDGWEVAAESSLNEGADSEIGVDMMDEKIGMSRHDFKDIGSDGYYQSEGSGAIEKVPTYPEKRNQEIFQEEGIEERIINKELVTDVGGDLKKQKASFMRKNTKSGMFAPMDMIRNVEIVENNPIREDVEEETKENPPRRTFNQEPPVDFHEDSFMQESVSEEKIQRAGKFFESRRASINNEDEYKSINVGSKVGKYFFVFAIIAILAILGLAAYLFLPKASISVHAKNTAQSVELQIDGNSTAGGVDLVNEIVPVKVITLADTLTKTYDATGSKDASNQKAKGTVTIYNEFSSSPQPLVANTRFESADKKIFRLVESVTIPGMTQSGTATAPGTVTADVIADESGDSYNIDATSFTIPGFQSSGTEKFTKIYAKSTSSMAGGGGKTQKVKVISDNDINSAKTKALQELKTSIIQKLKDSVGDGYIFLEDAVSVDDASYTQTKSSGDIADNFSITVRANANAIVFKETDVKAVASNSISKKGDRIASIPDSSIKLDFGKANVDFKAGTMIIRVHATGSIVPQIDLDKIKKDLLGKGDDEIEPYIKNHINDVQKVEIIYWPSFIAGKIPTYESRVDIFLDPASNTM